MKKEFLVIQLINNQTKNDLLSALLTTDVDIAKFAIYEPTLTDIFVLEVGDQA